MPTHTQLYLDIPNLYLDIPNYSHTYPIIPTHTQLYFFYFHMVNLIQTMSKLYYNSYLFNKQIKNDWIQWHLTKGSWSSLANLDKASSTTQSAPSPLITGVTTAIDDDLNFSSRTENADTYIKHEPLPICTQPLCFPTNHSLNSTDAIIF